MLIRTVDTDVVLAVMCQSLPANTGGSPVCQGFNPVVCSHHYV